MNRLLRAYCRFSRAERAGVLLLFVTTVLVFSADVLWNISLQRQEEAGDENARMRRRVWMRDYRSFAGSPAVAAGEFDDEDFLQTLGSAPSRAPVEADASSVRIKLAPFPFDPNRADSVTLRNLGLPARVVRNILHYRARGGRFRRASEFAKVYGLGKPEYTVLLPYIQIADTFSSAGRATSLLLAAREHSAPAKYEAGTQVDLNRADTAELKRIPGIGSGIARLITAYRARLGGFYAVEQLAEIRLNVDSLRPWFTVDSADIRRIDLNSAGVSRLKAHPYIDFYQAKIIVDYRLKHGRLSSLKPFRLYEEFGDSDLRRIAPYVCFE